MSETLPKEAGLPRHVAIIMDGNGRWARQHKKPRTAGHRAGVLRVRDITDECARLGIEQLTLYAFSKENWRRPKSEVRMLMRLLHRYLMKERPRLMEKNVRLRAIGALGDLDPDVRHELRLTEKTTAGNTAMTLCVALSYGGRAEIVEAARTLAVRAKAGELEPGSITEQTFADALYTAGMPDPDLLIRTAGEMRVSNFLLWQISYAELYVTPVCWPDFREAAFHDALRAYAQRTRTFGRIKEA